MSISISRPIDITFSDTRKRVKVTMLLRDLTIDNASYITRKKSEVKKTASSKKSRFLYYATASTSRTNVCRDNDRYLIKSHSRTVRGDDSRS